MTTQKKYIEGNFSKDGMNVESDRLVNVNQIIGQGKKKRLGSNSESIQSLKNIITWGGQA